VLSFFLSECGGKMHLREGEYEKAHTDFFEAFKNYYNSIYIGIWVISSDDCYRHLWLNKLSEDLQSQVSQVIQLIRK
jgi:hypothetical protein